MSQIDWVEIDQMIHQRIVWLAKSGIATAGDEWEFSQRLEELLCIKREVRLLAKLPEEESWRKMVHVQTPVADLRSLSEPKGEAV